MPKKRDPVSDPDAVLVETPDIGRPKMAYKVISWMLLESEAQNGVSAMFLQKNRFLS